MDLRSLCDIELHDWSGQTGGYPKDGPILSAHIFRSRALKKLQKTVSLRESTGSMNKCFNSHLTATALVETNN